MSTQTRTREQVEAAVETVEIEEMQCPLCQQWYADEDELVPVAVGAQYDSDVELVTADQVTQLCTGCAEGLFDYESVPEGRLEGVRRELRWWTPQDVGKAVGSVVTRLLPIAIAGGVVWGVFTITSDVVSTSAAEFSSAADVGVAALGFVPLVMMMIGLLLILIRMSLTIGPRTL